MMRAFFAEKYFNRQILVMWLILSAMLVITQWGRITIFQMGDADDHLRMAQIRDWLAGQSWFDVTQYRINPPEGGPMHWSRLVDVPVAAVILALRPLLGQMVAEQAAAVMIPLFTFGIVIALVAKITFRLFGHKPALLAAGAVFTIVPAINQLLPMRIDHHGWQIVLFLVCLSGLIDRKSPKGAAIRLGVAAALWLEISVEGLPFIIIFMGLLALRWILPAENNNEADAMDQFPVAILTLAAASIFLFIVTEGMNFAENFCDALSPFHIAALVATAAIINLPVWISGRLNHNLGVPAKLIIGIAAAASGIAAVMIMAPQCAGDAFSGLDPVVRDYWFDRTPEGLPLWQLEAKHWAGPLAGLLAGILALGHLFVTDTKLPKADKLVLAVLFLGTALVGAYVSRVTVYALCLANILLAPLVINIFRQSDTRSGLATRMSMRIAATALFVPSITGGLIYQMLPKNEPERTAVAPEDAATKYQKAFACHKLPAIQALGKLSQANIMTGLDVSPAVLQHTNLKITATGHHRNQMAMKDVILTFTGKPEKARQIMEAREIDYLVGCNGSPELDYYTIRAPDGFWAQLQNGQSFNWLEPQANIGPYQVWRVNGDSQKDRAIVKDRHEKYP